MGFAEAYSLHSILGYHCFFEAVVFVLKEFLIFWLSCVVEELSSSVIYILFIFFVANKCENCDI